MTDYAVVNRYTGHLLGMVRATSFEMAVTLARAVFGTYVTVEMK